jgi:rhodanese-related sulfurtransferase
MIKSITPTELKARLDDGEDLLVVDVRLDWELQISKLDFATQIVLQDLPLRANEIPKDKPVVFICRSGGRSMQAAEFLAFYGWPEENLMNLEGGILRWARDVDQSLPLNY